MSNKHPEYTLNFADVYLAELDYVKQRREQMDIPFDRIAPEIERVHKLKAQTEKVTEVSTTPSQEAPHFHVANADTGLVGLALSGGGVRSATFNLGLLQSLAKNKVLQCCDYLSTVSGGGYIGSCLNSLLADNKGDSTKKAEFPFRENDSQTLGERAEVNHLRATKNYLGLGDGRFSLDIWYMLGTTVSCMLLMSLVPLAVTFLAVLLFYFIPFEKPATQNFLLWYQLAIVLVAIFVLLIFTRMVMIRLRLILLFFRHSSESHLRHNKRIAWRAAIVSIVAGVSLLIGFIYWLAWSSVGQYQTFVYICLASLFVILVGILLGLFSTSNNKFQQTFVKIIMSTALTILVCSLFSWLLSGWYEDERLEQFARVMKQEPIQSELLKEHFQHLQLYLGMSDIEMPTWENQFIEGLGGKEAVTATGETVENVRNEAVRFLKVKQWIQSEGLTKVLTQMKRLSDKFESNNNISTLSTFLDEIWPLIKTSEQELAKAWIDKLVEAMQQVNEQTLSVKWSVAKWKIIVVIGFLGIGLLININRNSLHYFYRDRLSKTYLIRWDDKEGIQQNQALLLKELHQCCNGPYYLVNTTLNVPRSENPALSGRGADFFIFSKYYCGAESTGYRSTESYRKGQTKLATAMAISGAAASPQMGTHTKPIMAILMTDVTHPSSQFV